MKKAISILANTIIILALIACSAGEQADLYVVDGHYNMGAQDLIDAINYGIDQTGDSRYCKYPDFVSSGETIKSEGKHIIGDDNASLTLYTDGEQQLNKIVIEWVEFRPSQEARNTYDFTVGTIIGGLAPRKSDSSAVFSALDMDAYGTNEYTTTTTVNGSRLTYKYRLNGMYRDLIIEPE